MIFTFRWSLHAFSFKEQSILYYNIQENLYIFAKNNKRIVSFFEKASIVFQLYNFYAIDFN